MENETLLTSIDYDVASEEENTAFKEYQRKFTTKGKIIKSALFFIIGLLFIYRIIMDSSYTLGWGLMGVSFLMAIYIWINPILIRKNLLKALKNIEGDKYRFELYEDYFSIKTIKFADGHDVILPVEDENKVKSTNEPEESEDSTPEKIPPRIVKIKEDPVEVIEKEDVFIIFLIKHTYYTLPKRCMDDNTISIIRNFFNINNTHSN